MTNVNDKLIEKLKKLFALGKSPNAHEAMAAMEKANQLMREHQISMTDIDLRDDGAAVIDRYQMEDGLRRVWVAVLANACARLYNARCFIARGNTLIFVGTPTDISMAKMTLNHLYDSWKSIVEMDWKNEPANVVLNKLAYKNSHGQGFSTVILDRVEKLVAERNVEVKSATGRDLVLVKSAAIDEALKDKKVGQRKLNESQGGGTVAGAVRGAVIPLNGGIENDKPLAIAKQA